MRNLKKVIALVAVFAMLVSTVAFAQTYTDVATDDNYSEAISMLSSLDILTGDTDDNGNSVFRPNDTITRAEVATIVERIQNVKSAAQTNTEFTDVTASHWASGFISLAAAQGVVNGYGDGTFGPEDPVLYEQAIKMVVEAIGYAPFVEDNGGYYAGHLLAAQRYGVLDGVVGGSIGAEATRGQVAQLVYNAIDTPIMDRNVYGSTAEYIIYDGTNYAYKSLLTRDLDVKKGTGIVVDNMVQGTIDNTREEEVKISWNNTTENSHYDLDEVDTIYANGTNVGSLIGKEVTVYLQETNKSGIYDVVSVAETNKNKTIEIDLSDISSVSDTEVVYYKDGARTSTTQKVKINDAAYYNGVKISDTDRDTIISNVLANAGWNGRITLLDNGADTNYNVMFIEVAVPAVVDDVTAAGKVSFKNDPRTIDGKRVALDFDEDIEDQVIVMTKDGKEVDYTELTEWSVLSVLANATNDYYVIDVIDSAAIEGTVSEVRSSDTSANGSEYKIDGEWYDIAKGYEFNGRLAAGSAGVFYADKYGKIVAYNKNGTTVASDNYAYILNTSATTDDWGKNNVRVQFIDKTGAIGDVYLASSFKIEYASSNITTGLASTTVGGDTYYEGTVKTDNLTVATATALASALKNQLITYSLSGTEITKITFAQDSDEDENSLFLNNAAAGVEYDEDNENIKVGKKYDVTDDTIVFFISNSTSNVWTSGTVATGTATKTASKIGTKASLSDDEYDFVQVFDADDDVASVLVIYNTTGGISSSNSVAVIDSVGDATIDGEDVTAVTYWYNGEQYTAYTDENYQDDPNTSITDAKQGDIWKFAVVDSTITEGRSMAKYTRNTAKADNDGAAALTFVTAAAGTTSNPATLTAKESIEFGPVVDYTNKSIRIAPYVTSAYDLTDYISIKVKDSVNVYVVDPAKRTNKVYVDSASAVEYDSDLVELKSTQKVVKKGDASTVLVAAGKQALGMMDFVAAVSYDDDVQDIVIYKAPDFGKYEVQ